MFGTYLKQDWQCFGKTGNGSGQGCDTLVYAIDIFVSSIVTFTINAAEKSTDKRSSERSGNAK